MFTWVWMPGHRNIQGVSPSQCQVKSRPFLPGTYNNSSSLTKLLINFWTAFLTNFQVCIVHMNTLTLGSPFNQLCSFYKITSWLQVVPTNTTHVKGSIGLGSWSFHQLISPVLCVEQQWAGSLWLCPAVGLVHGEGLQKAHQGPHWDGLAHLYTINPNGEEAKR